MSLHYLENIPDAIVKNDLTNFLQYNKYLNYNHLFYKIGQGNIFYPECFLYQNKEEINLYGGYCENGFYNKLKYNIKEKKYIFYKIDCDDYIVGQIFTTFSWTEMFEYINKIFINYIK